LRKGVLNSDYDEDGFWKLVANIIYVTLEGQILINEYTKKFVMAKIRIRRLEWILSKGVMSDGLLVVPVLVSKNICLPFIFTFLPLLWNIMNLVFATLTAILFAPNQVAHFFNSWFTTSISWSRSLPQARPWVSSANIRVSKLEALGKSFI